MKREAFKMYLKPGCEAEYERRHAAIWPEMKALLAKNGVFDYSIYWDKGDCTEMVGLYGRHHGSQS